MLLSRTDPGDHPIESTGDHMNQGISAEDGLLVNKNGHLHLFHGTVLLALADTLAAHQLGGYKEGERGGWSQLTKVWQHFLTCNHECGRGLLTLAGQE